MIRNSKTALIGLALTAVCACGGERGLRYPTAVSPLTLDRVVLYRNGVGYFERSGKVDGDVLRLRVRKDQINDLLKSLTVVDRKKGKALSISMPLDPQAWQNAALSLLAPGRGNLAQMLDALKGVHVSVDSDDGNVRGRIVMVERMHPAPTKEKQADYVDYKLSLLDGDEVKVVRLSTVRSVQIEEGDLVMQLHRRLDASAGEGMFQQITVEIRLAGSKSHDLAVSYVVSAPLWKPTYRVVLSDDGSREALLQGWAVVDNTSGESWDSVMMSLTSGAPIAFRYDLHTPQDVDRPDLTNTGVSKQVHVAVGETGYGEEDAEEEPASLNDAAADEMMYEKRSSKAPSAARAKSRSPLKSEAYSLAPAAPAPRGPALDIGSLRASTEAKATAKRVSGLTRFDLGQRVTVPDGSSTMVALINETVNGEQLFLFRPGGSGSGFEFNPYRVVRFKNSTAETIARIHQCGGISVIAHPGLIDDPEVVPALIEQGVMGLEAYCHEHDEEMVEQLLRLAAEHNLLVTGGSDYHGDMLEKTFKLGDLQVPYDCYEQLKKARGRR